MILLSNILKEMENPCWKGYEMVGMKDKGGRKVPNCVPKSETYRTQNEEAPMNPAAGQPGGFYGGGVMGEEMCPTCKKPMTQCECGMYEDYDELDVEPEEVEDFIKFLKAYKNTLDEANCNCVFEAEYQGRDVQLGKPTQGDVKKFKVFVKNPKTGKIIKVNFGQKGMKIRKSNPAARKSFRARMHCDNPGPRTKANYWSCRKW